MILSDLASPAEAGFAKAGNRFPLFGIMLQQAAEEASPVIPGRAQSANPESSQIEFRRISGFRIASSWRPE
jgi:hypothetical protein